MINEVVSIQWVCETLGCSRSRVFQLLAAGTLVRAPRFGRSLRIYKDSVDAALEPVSNGRKRRARTHAPERIRREELEHLTR